MIGRNPPQGGIERVLLVAGGTGGHIWPAVSFGMWLMTNRPGTRIEYISGTRELERDIYETAGILPHAIPLDGSPIGAPRGTKWKRWRDIFRGFSKARRLVGGISPDLCILFGGYVSVPVLFAGLARKIPLVAHEQNAHAGRVTRLAHKLKVPVMTGWNSCAPFKEGDFTHVGVPVRAFESENPQEAWDSLGLAGERPEGPLVVVMTGSLGSRSLQEKIAELAKRADFVSWHFLVVTPEVKTPVEMTERLTFLPKRWDIAPFYAIADILVVRGGASTLTEVLAADIPAIVVPWRGASDDHQMKNALAFSSEGKAYIWNEAGETIDDFIKKIKNLHQTHHGNTSAKDKRMYNAAGNICEKVWDAALQAYERRDTR